MAKKILIVDDEKNIRTSLTYYLNKFEYDSDTASSGNEALELLKKNSGESYELILLDLRMPDLTGLQYWLK